ncbi:ATP-binding cassette domain-containing protein [Patescibacteria group bacterium]|nr:ATP-binding cassette domain-containing protein [Patescibacteria group bacterium]MBU1755243.1 ATP-binding cassette domain-containing protein [Patescibacteria group bacterium]
MAQENAQGPREAVLRFEDVSFGYGHNHPILEEVAFTIRKGMKVTVMGQNGAGKSTIFKLIEGEYTPDDGNIQIPRGVTIATAKQVISPKERELTVRAFFESRFTEKVYDIDPKIEKVLEVVNLVAPFDRIVSSFSGGQQARLLLASALIQNPDILLLDEPTNNLDKAGIEHLTDFLKSYEKTCMVISHDAEFLNSFTQGVLYLDIHTRKIEQYVGNYYDLLKEIQLRIERENRKNAQLAKEIQANKDKANFFAQKGGKMRVVAKKMRTAIEEMEEDKVDVRREDKTIRNFTIPAQPELIGEIVGITSLTTINTKTYQPKEKKVDISLKKKQHLLLKGPNGIGKSTLLEALAKGNAPGAVIAPDVRVGYYRQDFSTLNFEDTVFDSLIRVTPKQDEQTMRATAAGFLLSGQLMKKKIGMLSEGQKGLVAFASLVLQSPGLLILDEPTNHINFRHLPVIAKALDQYEGAMILVSHVPEFLEQIRIDEVLDLGA